MSQDPPKYVIPPDPVIEVYKREVDRTLLRENLKLTVEERLLQLVEQARLADEFDRSRHSGTRP